MPSVVDCYRTYKGEDGKEVTEHHRMLGVNAREAVKNGKGEWKMSPPAGKPVVKVESKQEMTDSEARPERRGRSPGKRAESGLAAAEEVAEGVE